MIQRCDPAFRRYASQQQYLATGESVESEISPLPSAPRTNPYPAPVYQEMVCPAWHTCCHGQPPEAPCRLKKPKHIVPAEKGGNEKKEADVAEVARAKVSPLDKRLDRLIYRAFKEDDFDMQCIEGLLTNGASPAFRREKNESIVAAAVFRGDYERLKEFVNVYKCPIFADVHRYSNEGSLSKMLRRALEEVEQQRETALKRAHEIKRLVDKIEDMGARWESDRRHNSELLADLERVDQELQQLKQEVATQQATQQVDKEQSIGKYINEANYYIAQLKEKDQRIRELEDITLGRFPKRSRCK